MTLKKITSRKVSGFFNPRILLACLLCSIGLMLALFGSGALSTVYAQAKATAPAAATESAEENQEFSSADKEGRFVYLIEFAEGGALQRQNRAPGESFNPDAAATKAVLSQVEAEQLAHGQAMDQAIGRAVSPSHRYMTTHSGIAARLTPAEADIVAKLPGVTSVERERLYHIDTFRGPQFIGADSIWNGSAVPGGTGTRGQGIVVGVLDTGIVVSHPSFANDSSCGHGVAGAPNKLISALDCSTATGPGGLCNGTSPGDTNGHGSHTASTAAGNTVGQSAVPAPNPGFGQISGVAPCANIRAYKVCPTNSCGQADIVAGMNSVLLHGDVRVMNFSISGGRDPYNDNDRRKLDLVDANIVVAASAGNTSATITDPIGNVGHLGPWVMTVAASTRDGEFAGRVSAVGGPANTQNIPATKGSDSPVGTALTNYPIRHFTGQDPTAEGCTAGEDTAPANLTPFPAGFFNNAIALIHRGNCPFTKKIQNAFNAGATMVIIRNNQAALLSMSTPGQPPIPAYSIEQAPGNALVAHVDANPSTATINFALDPIPSDVLANFSLRGPTPTSFNMLTKPDITAPGVNIYAAYATATGGPTYSSVSGTSMSSPHAAGSAALIRAIRPAWTPSEVKSALMMTTKKTGLKDNGVTPWDPDDVGNGRVDLTKAARAGVVMDEIFSRYLAANPGTGGDPKTLNIPSMRNMNCAPHCTWTRTVRNTLTTPSNWTVSTAMSVPGFNISVSPSSFSFNGNLAQTQQLTITAVPTTNLTSAIGFGEVRLTETGNQAPEAHMTVAIKGEPFVVGAVSRKMHGATNYDIPLPLLGTPGLESRVGAVEGTHQIVVTFTSPVTLTGVAVTEGTGTATSNIVGSDVIITVANAPDRQRLAVTLQGVSNGTTTTNVRVPMNLLAGDTNANGTVSATDIGQTKAASSPGTVTQQNFRTDVNANGSINATDISIVKARSGNTLP
jgi:subtilisin family serine protease